MFVWLIQAFESLRSKRCVTYLKHLDNILLTCSSSMLIILTEIKRRRRTSMLMLSNDEWQIEISTEIMVRIEDRKRARRRKRKKYRFDSLYLFVWRKRKRFVWNPKKKNFARGSSISLSLCAILQVNFLPLSMFGWEEQIFKYLIFRRFSLEQVMYNWKTMSIPLVRSQWLHQL